jgi:hypothetical protein
MPMVMTVAMAVMMMMMAMMKPQNHGLCLQIGGRNDQGACRDQDNENYLFHGVIGNKHFFRAYLTVLTMLLLFFLSSTNHHRQHPPV